MKLFVTHNYLQYLFSSLGLCKNIFIYNNGKKCLHKTFKLYLTQDNYLKYACIHKEFKQLISIY